MLEQLGQDLRYAFRTMAANRLFTALAALSLALGIGANAAIYSFMDAILLRSLPVAEPDRLVVLNWNAQGSTANRTKSCIGDGSYVGRHRCGRNQRHVSLPVLRDFPQK